MIVEVVNSDYFFNMDSHLSNWEITKHGAKHISVDGMGDKEAEAKISGSYPKYFKMHGLLGQTWRNVQYDHKRVYQGSADDYLVGYLLDPNFVYSLYDVKI